MFSIILLFFNQCTLLFFSFGSKLRSLKSGIIYNNELADYFTNSSYTKDENGKERPYPKPTVNAPLGGRRPLSSTCPSVIVDNNGDVKMVVGGSGGTRITLSTAWVRYVYQFESHIFTFSFNMYLNYPFCRCYERRNIFKRSC